MTGKAALIAMCGFCAVTQTGGADPATLRLTGYNATKLSTFLNFDNGGNEARTIVFMDRDQQFLMTTSKAEGLLDWKYVTAIRVVSDADPSFKLATIEFVDKYDQKHKKFELGLIDEAHLAKLKHRYGQQLNFATK